MNIASTTEPKSDQQNFDDYISGDKTVTIEKVTKGSPEQPVELHLVEFPGRPYKPGKSMRRVLIACWGAEASVYEGRKMTLYGDPTVRFGGEAVGGIRIRALSDIDEQKSIQLTVTRGKRKPFVVEPIRSAAADTKAHADALNAATTLGELQTAWIAASRAGVATLPELIELKDTRKAELSNPDASIAPAEER